MAKAKFVVRKGPSGMFRFNLIGPNGNVIATSQAYQSRASALRGVEAVRKHAADAELVDQAGTRAGSPEPRRAHSNDPRRCPRPMSEQSPPTRGCRTTSCDHASSVSSGGCATRPLEAFVRQPG